MSASDVHHLSAQVLWAAFILAGLFGAIAQRTHFCAMGAVSDAYNMGDWTRMRQWALAVAVAMLGFTALVSVGAVDPSKTLYASSKMVWLSALVGGLLFGFGMVLASGCGSKTLVRLGAGNLKSLVVFLAMGVAAFATLKGVTAVLRVATVDQFVLDAIPNGDAPQAVASHFALHANSVRWVMAIICGGALGLWALRGPEFLRWDNLLAGVGIGAVIVAMWWVSGHLGYLSEDPNTLQEAFLATSSGKMEAMSFVSPMAYSLNWLMYFSDQSNTLSIGVVSVAGVVLGSGLTAALTGQFRWEGFTTVEDLASHLVGGVCMGVGGVTALGCTVGQGLSGISTLNATSLVATLAIIAGAIGAFRYQIWRLS